MRARHAPAHRWLAAAALGVGLSWMIASPAVSAPLATAPATFSAEAQETFSETYGQREAERLQAMLAEYLADALTAAGADLTGSSAPVALHVVIEDAKPNRPTFQELTDRPGLSLADSFGVGGASLRAEFRDASGAVIATVAHRWYQNDIWDAQYATTWSDARRAMRVFAGKVADAYAGLPASG